MHYLHKSDGRVLVVSERPAFPSHDGARLRLVSLLRALDDVDVDVIHFKQPGESFIPVEEEMGHCRTIATIDHDNRVTTTGRIRSILSSEPYGVSRNRNSQMERLLRSIPRDRYAIALFCGINMANYRPAIATDRSLLDLCDSELRHIEVRYHFVRDPLKKAYFALQHTKTLRELRKSAVCFDGWLVISEMEAESLRGYFPRVPIGVVGNSLSSTRVRSDIHSRPKQIVLIGNFDYYPNVDAAVYFATEIMPLLRRSQEGCLLRIIGKNPPSRLCRLAAADIEVTGYVEDLPAAVAEGSVFVCPLRIGTGIKNKVIEAMGCGVPVVSTGLGVEGTSAVSGVHYLQAESAHEFADCISRLLQNPRLCGTLTHNARDLVHECFSPAVPRQQLGAFFGRLGLMNQTSVVGR